MKTGRIVGLVIAEALSLAVGAAAAREAPGGWDSDRRLTRSALNSMTSINFARSVAVDEAGRVHVAWVEEGPGSADLYYRRSTDAGGTWGPPVPLLAAPARAFNPSIASSGDLVTVAWQDSRPGGSRIRSRRSLDGGVHWEEEAALTGQESGSPSLAVAGSAVHLVYARPLGPDDTDIFYRRSLDRGRTWEDEVRISALPGNSWVPTVAASGAAVYLAWADGTGSPEPCCLEEEYFARSSDGGATWSAPVRLTFDPPGARANSWAPSLAAGGAEVWIVWFDQRTGGWEIYTKRSRDYGRTWTADRRLTSSGAALRPSIARHGNELLVAYWDSRPGEAEEVWLLRSPNRGRRWEAPVRLTYAPGSSILPSIAAGAHGVHVVWTDLRDGNAEVYTKRLPGVPAAAGDGSIP